MKRIAKGREVRREEFIESAEALFNSKGYESTSVDDIVKSMGVAKGLFYYYFESKGALLDAMTDRLIEQMRVAIQEVSGRDDLKTMDKLEMLMIVSIQMRSKSSAVVNYFHEPRNKSLHFLLEQRSYEFLIPAFEKLISQGNREGVFRAEHPHGTALAFLGAMSAIGHERTDDLSRKEAIRIIRTFESISERLLAAKPGTFKMYERLSAKAAKARGG
jgi:AcrR family transcriptional regulator